MHANCAPIAAVLLLLLQSQLSSAGLTRNSSGHHVAPHGLASNRTTVKAHSVDHETTRKHHFVSAQHNISQKPLALPQQLSPPHPPQSLPPLHLRSQHHLQATASQAYHAPHPSRNSSQHAPQSKALRRSDLKRLLPSLPPPPAPPLKLQSQRHSAHRPKPAAAPVQPKSSRHEWFVWVLFASAVVLALVVEELVMAGLPNVSMPTATVWLCSFGAWCTLLLLALGAYRRTLAEPAALASLMVLNIMLSPDNLIVFMVLLKQAQLPAVHHRRVITAGFTLAVGLRLAAMMLTSQLLAACSPLQTLLAVALLAKGLEMLWGEWRRSRSQAGGAVSTLADAADEANHVSNSRFVRVLERCVAVKFSDETDSKCIGCEQRPKATGCLPLPHCYLTRTATLTLAIGASDLSFSSDNIASALALTSDAFAMTVSVTLSVMLLRPLYFMAAAFLDYLDGLDSALGVILVLIGTKLCLNQAGVDTPLWLFAGLLMAWRVLIAAHLLSQRRRQSDRQSAG